MWKLNEARHLWSSKLTCPKVKSSHLVKQSPYIGVNTLLACAIKWGIFVYKLKKKNHTQMVVATKIMTTFFLFEIFFFMKLIMLQNIIKPFSNLTFILFFLFFFCSLWVYLCCFLIVWVLNCFYVDYLINYINVCMLIYFDVLKNVSSGMFAHWRLRSIHILTATG